MSSNNSCWPERFASLFWPNNQRLSPGASWFGDRLKSRIAFFSFLSIAAFSTWAETTRLDNDPFAFVPTGLRGAKVADKWLEVDSPLRLGMQGKFFLLDTRGISAIPSPCQQRFLFQVPSNPKAFKLPKAVLDGEYVQQLFFRTDGCDGTILMGFQVSRELDNRFELLRQRQFYSISIGMIGLRNGDQMTAIQFAIYPQDAPR